MWVIEIKARTDDAAVRQRIARDVDGWREAGPLQVSVSERESGRGERHVGASARASASLGASAVRSKFGLGPRRHRPPPQRVQLTDLPSAVPFGVFVLADTPPVLDARVERDEEDRVTSATITYPVFEEEWHVGNVWITVSGGPLPISPWESWRAEDGVSICEDHSSGYFRYKVRLEHEGTYIQVESAVYEALDDVLDLVRDLVPYPPSPGA